jgi:hypothetical protein
LNTCGPLTVGWITPVKRAEKAPPAGSEPETVVVPVAVLFVLVRKFHATPGSTQVSPGLPDSSVLAKYSAVRPAFSDFAVEPGWYQTDAAGLSDSAAI